MSSSPNMATQRRRGRELALKALYEADQTRHSVESSLQWLTTEHAVAPEALEFARALVEGVAAHLADVDAAIARHAPLFPVSGLAAVDRTVLRLALFELLVRREAPPKVVINEAVELAKTFGSESSPRFVNGVLGSALAERARRPEGEKQD